MGGMCRFGGEKAGGGGSYIIGLGGREEERRKGNEGMGGGKTALIGGILGRENKEAIASADEPAMG